MPQELYVRDGGTWKIITGANGMHVKDGGVWKEVSEGYVRDAGAWKQFFVKSDPITLNFYPIWIGNYGKDNSYTEPTYTMSKTGVYQGDWQAVGSTPGQGETITVLRFDDDAISSAFGGRTVCSSVTLRLTGENGYTSSGPYAEIHSTTSSSVDLSSRPTSIGALPTLANTTQSANRFANGDTWTTTLPNAVGDGLIAETIHALCLWHAGQTEPDRELYRGVFRDLGDTSNLRPYLSITADFA